MIEFTKAELNSAAKRFKIENQGPELDLEGQRSKTTGFFQPQFGESLASHKGTRIDRFWHLLMSAWTTRDIGLKTAHYCSAFEALLSSGSSELRHQVAERITVLTQAANPINCYNEVRQIYDIRSRILHGDAIPKKADVKQLSIQADKISRELALLVLSDHELASVVSGDSKYLNAYFLDLLLSKHHGN